MGDFNAQNSINEGIFLSNYWNPNPLWLDEDLELANWYTTSFEDLGKNLFDYEMVKFSSAQDLIICNGLTKWPNSS